jgi:hypothetical protein
MPRVTGFRHPKDRLPEGLFKKTPKKQRYITRVKPNGWKTIARNEAISDEEYHATDPIDPLDDLGFPIAEIRDHLPYMD